MKRNTEINMFNILLVLFAVVMSLVQITSANDNYDMVMMDDNIPAESIQLQNFDTFYNAETPGNDMSELQMEESRGSGHIRPPQALTEKEKRVREQEIQFDVQREKRNQQSLKKGNTRPNKNGEQWEEFDYDAYVNHG